MNMKVKAGRKSRNVGGRGCGGREWMEVDEERGESGGERGGEEG